MGSQVHVLFDRGCDSQDMTGAFAPAKYAPAVNTRILFLASIVKFEEGTAMPVRGVKVDVSRPEKFIVFLERHKANAVIWLFQASFSFEVWGPFCNTFIRRCPSVSYFRSMMLWAWFATIPTEFSSKLLEAVIISPVAFCFHSIVQSSSIWIWEWNTD